MISYFLGLLKYIFYPKVSIRAVIDRTSKLSKKAKINRGARVIDSNIGEYSYVGMNSWVCIADVGKFCSIANRVNIGLGNHTINYLSTSPIFTEKYNGTGFSWINKTIAPPFKRTIIGNDVWIGFGAMVIGGVKIGDGAIIGAGSIVTKDIPPFAIAVGSPAKVIKYRFSEETIEKILQNPWWNKSEKDLKQNIIEFQKVIR
ncbi:CatB-related O-acetyltransferase [uncultured Duncaniella sp.]|nr:CatB-related O-acetyltransferase [uncultured Duncaniella sp.]